VIAFRRSAFLCGLTIALLGFALGSFAADVPARIAAIHAADDSWVNAYNSGDLDTVISLYDEHAVIILPEHHARAAGLRSAPSSLKTVPSIFRVG
jgi:hypothetical protein